MSNTSCTKTTRKGACCTGIWKCSCTGDVFLILSDEINWPNGAQHVVMSPAFTALVFESSSSVPCLLMNNETKPPEICLAAPYSCLSFPWPFWWWLHCFIDCHCQPKSTGILVWDTDRALPGARPSFSCLGRSKDAKTSGTRNYSTPKIEMGRIKY